jgi:predicted anti-sigma-YlaC factor YlaD
LLFSLPLLVGCSIHRLAVNRIGDAMADSGSLFAQEEDPELARAAIPFALKTLEGLLAERPRHRGLLLAAASGFAQYSYAFVQQDADFLQDQDLARATEQRRRAKALYLRARDYGLRGLELDLPGFAAQLRADPDPALARARAGQVPLLFYTAAAWAGAFALDVTDPALSVAQTLMEKMLRRALALDPDWNQGAIHELLLAWEAGHADAGGSLARARAHFEEARRLSRGGRASVFVAQAESLALPAQDRAAFELALGQALAIDGARADTPRLANAVAQRRARWLLARVDELFLEQEPQS